MARAIACIGLIRTGVYSHQASHPATRARCGAVLVEALATIYVARGLLHLSFDGGCFFPLALLRGLFVKLTAAEF